MKEQCSRRQVAASRVRSQRALRSMCGRLATQLASAAVLVALVVPAHGQTPPNPGTLTTLAGRASAGAPTGNYRCDYNNTPAVGDTIKVSAESLARMSDGSYVIYDRGANCIHRLANGMLTTIAGNGTQGDPVNNVPATQTPMRGVTGVAIAPDGGIFYSDSDNHVIRRFTIGGNVATIAGQFVSPTTYVSSPNANPLLAQFNNPFGLAFDSAGNLFVAQWRGNCVSKIANAATTAGAVSNVVGNCQSGSPVGGFAGDNGAASGAQTNQISSVAFDSDGNLYFTDVFNQRVRMVRASTTGVATQIESSDPITTVAESLNLPYSLAVGSPHFFYVSEIDGHRIRVVRRATTGNFWIDTNRVVTTLIESAAGNGVTGYSADQTGDLLSAGLNRPNALSIDPDGSIAFADQNNFRIRRIAAFNPFGVPLSNCTAPGGVLSNSNQTCKFTVTTNGDSIDTSDSNLYVPLAGSLRDAMMNANAWGNYGNRVGGNSIIEFAPNLAGQTFGLAYALPMVMSNVEVNGPAARITIDGNGAGSGSGRRCFFLSGLPIEGTGGPHKPNDGLSQAINVSLSNILLSNCFAKGGRGYGGGMGAGAGVFANERVAFTLRRLSTANAQAYGGETGASSLAGGGLGGEDGGGIFSGGGGLSGNGTRLGGGIGGDGGGFGLGSANSSSGIALLSPRQGFPQAASGGNNGGGVESGHASGSGSVGSVERYGTGIGGVLSQPYGGVGGGGVLAGFGAGGGSASGLNHAGFGGGASNAGASGFGGGGPYNGRGGFGGGGITNSAGFGGGSGAPTREGAAMGAGLFVVGANGGTNIAIVGDGEMTGGAVTSTASALGNGTFLRGSGTLTFDQASIETFSLRDDVADQTGSWPVVSAPVGTHPYAYPTGGPFYNFDWSYSSDGRWNLVKNGAGTLILGGANTFTGGASVVNGGTVRVTYGQGLGFGNWTNHATIDIASPLTVTMGSTNNANGTMPESSFTQSASGVLKLGITGAGCVADQLNAKTNLTLAGTLIVNVSGGCVPASGQSFTIMTANLGNGVPSVGTRSGSFTNVIVVGMPAGRTLATSYTGTTVVLTEAAGSNPAILNIDNSNPATIYDAATDGVLLMRYLLGYRGAALIANARGAGASLRDATQIENHIAGSLVAFDVDGDGQTLALTDGVMILRRLLNPGAAISNATAMAAITANAKRGTRTDAEVVSAIDALKP